MKTTAAATTTGTESSYLLTFSSFSSFSLFFLLDLANFVALQKVLSAFVFS